MVRTVLVAESGKRNQGHAVVVGLTETVVSGLLLGFNNGLGLALSYLVLLLVFLVGTTFLSLSHVSFLLSDFEGALTGLRISVLLVLSLDIAEDSKCISEFFFYGQDEVSFPGSR